MKLIQTITLLLFIQGCGNPHLVLDNPPIIDSNPISHPTPPKEDKTPKDKLLNDCKDEIEKHPKIQNKKIVLDKINELETELELEISLSELKDKDGLSDEFLDALELKREDVEKKSQKNKESNKKQSDD